MRAGRCAGVPTFSVKFHVCSASLVALDVKMSRYRVQKTRAYRACVMSETPVTCHVNWCLAQFKELSVLPSELLLE